MSNDGKRRRGRPCTRDVDVGRAKPAPPPKQALTPEPRFGPAEIARRSGFVKLYAEDWHFVRRTLERYGVPARDADDMTQEVFGVALRRIEDLDATRSARAWLFVTAMQLATNYRNQARHRIEPLSVTWNKEPSSDEMDVETALVAGEERRMAREIIDKLSPPLREILVQHDLEERPMAEIAAELGISIRAGHARLRAAREEVRERGRALLRASLHIRSQRKVCQPDALILREVIHAIRYAAQKNARPLPRTLRPTCHGPPVDGLPADEPCIFFMTA